MPNITKEEIKEWKEHPTTRFILYKATEYANEHLTRAPTTRHQRDQICDEVQGIRMVLNFILNYEEAV